MDYEENYGEKDEPSPALAFWLVGRKGIHPAIPMVTDECEDQGVQPTWKHTVGEADLVTDQEGEV